MFARNYGRHLMNERPGSIDYNMENQARNMAEIFSKMEARAKETPKIIEQGMVEIMFQLLDYKTREGCVPAVTGSIVELGEWRPERAVEAYISHQPVESSTTAGENSFNSENIAEHHSNNWFCTVRIPVAIEYDWNWVLISKNDNMPTFVTIENTVFRRDDAWYFDKIFATYWGQNSFHSTNRTGVEICEVTIRTQFDKDLNKYSKVAIIGSTPALGCWMPQHPIIAELKPGYSFGQIDMSKTSSNLETVKIWEVKVKLPRGCQHLWKWIVIDVNTNYIYEWEDRSNRVLYIRTNKLTLEAPWNSENEARIISAETTYPFNGSLCQLDSARKQEAIESIIRRNELENKFYYQLMTELLEYIMEYHSNCNKFNRKTLIKSGHLLKDVTDSSYPEDSALKFIIIEDDNFNILLFSEQYARISHNTDLVQSAKQILLEICNSENYHYQHRVNIVRSDEPLEYKLTRDNDTSLMYKIFYNKEKHIYFELHIRKIPKFLPTGPDENMVEVNSSSNYIATRSCPVPIKLKQKNIIKHVLKGAEPDISFFELSKDDKFNIFLESSTDAAQKFGGIDDDTKTWDILSLKQTDVDTGAEEYYIFKTRLKKIWYITMNRFKTR